MSYRRFVKRFFGWMKNQRALSLFFAIMLVLLALPGSAGLFTLETGAIIGIPASFFVLTLLAPLIGMFLLALYLRLAEDNDRHDPELENE